MKKNKWQCDVCYKVFKTKKDLIHHLAEEFDEATQTAGIACDQLEDMGIENPYKF